MSRRLTLRHLRNGFVAGSAAVLLLAAAAPSAAAAVAPSLYYPAVSAADSSGTVSGDWAGWDVTGSTYTSVAASWTEPTVTCTTDDTSYSAYWVGLDGDGSESVEQIGTSADCDAGTPNYSAWYEFYPESSVSLPNTVKAGDKLNASVKYSTSGSYTLVLTDSTQKWTKTVTGTAPEGTNASAEIIAEAPSSSRAGDVLPLADFHSVTFSDVTVNGKKLSELSGATKINMADESRSTMATTTALNSTGGFGVSWVSSGSSSEISSAGGRGSGGFPGSGTGTGSTGSGTGSTGTGTGTGTGSDGTGSDGTGSWPSADGWPGANSWPGTDGFPGAVGGWGWTQGDSGTTDGSGSADGYGTWPYSDGYSDGLTAGSQSAAAPYWAF